mmetsp:Transcript_52653/g.137164  ORF Transcript_52653/g.137164 Transcript_52653/m.137164 type:complete len:240 (-) Transcript_52653:556-1275(-)
MPRYADDQCVRVPGRAGEREWALALQRTAKRLGGPREFGAEVVNEEGELTRWNLCQAYVECLLGQRPARQVRLREERPRHLRGPSVDAVGICRRLQRLHVVVYPGQFAGPPPRGEEAREAGDPVRRAVDHRNGKSGRLLRGGQGCMVPRFRAPLPCGEGNAFGQADLPHGRAGGVGPRAFHDRRGAGVPLRLQRLQGAVELVRGQAEDPDRAIPGDARRHEGPVRHQSGRDPRLRRAPE